MSSGTALAVGATFSTVLVRDLPRAVIVQYAGASGDYNPLHHDELYAREVAGYPSVIAHGMFTMGLTARMVTDLVGAGRLRSLDGRFHAPVLPGDTLTGRVTVTSLVATSAAIQQAVLRLETVNQREEMVFSGQAVADQATITNGVTR
jgi:acyl dehydratase